MKLTNIAPAEWDHIPRGSEHSREIRRGRILDFSCNPQCERVTLGHGEREEGGWQKAGCVEVKSDDRAMLVDPEVAGMNVTRTQAEAIFDFASEINAIYDWHVFQDLR